jgi:KipI family sensor histidine kinase inhibitor
MLDTGRVRIRDVGWSAVLVECASPPAVAAWLAGRVDATDIVPGERTVLVDGASAALVRDALSGFVASSAPAGSRLVEIPTVYDGDDLGLVAEHWSASEDEVVARHLATGFTVAFCGFAPGFGYLTGLPWSVPRLSSPRPRVPAGSVALAGRYTGVYPSASPGGWLLIGRTSVRLFDVEAEPPALLTPGTRVRFVRA